MKAVVMQPTYLSWMGYFDLIDQSDIFVFLDDVQFEKQSWQQRNKIKTPQGWQWLSIPVVKKFPQLIKDVQISNNIGWAKIHWKTIVQNYEKAPAFANYKDAFEHIYSKNWDKLADLNMALIKLICDVLGIKKDFIRSSDINVPGDKVVKLVNICHKINATTYLSPVGSAGYIEEDNRFKSEGITLEYHNYEFPRYSQLYGEYVPYLSVVDLLFNCGESALGIIKKGRASAGKG